MGAGSIFDMLRITPSIILAALFLAGCSQNASDTKSLFDGNSLAGWSIQNNGQFSVKDGAIFIDQGTGWLRSDATYGDFSLYMEFRFLEENANSGIFVRTGPNSKDDENGWPNDGYQIQCMDSTTHIKPIGSMIPYGAPPFIENTDLDAIKRAYRPTKEWNTYEITAKGETLSVVLNGIEVSTSTDIKNLTGHIGIQAENGLVEFRKIEITELK